MFQLRYSNDGVENFGPWRDLPSGNVGQFLYPIIARRLGYARHRVWHIRDTGSRAQNILAASIQLNGAGQWSDFPLPDGTYSDATRPWAHQDVCGYLPTPAEQSGGRSATKYETVPGLPPFAVVGDGPHRGARDVEGRMFVVSGRKLYRVDATGAATDLGTIPGTSSVSMTHNQVDGGNQLVIATGDNSYVYNTATGVLSATGIPLVCVDFINQLIVGVDAQRRFWRYSGLADATAWNSLDNESAESAPDRVVGLIVSQGEVLVFGERTIEVWQNSPTDNTAFQRGTVIERGCLSARTICRLDNSVFFVDNNGIPCRLQGYSPVPIAPKALINEISSGDPTKLFAFTFEDKGYVVYYLTAQDGRTFGYDVTCQRWHRRESYGLDRWRINTLFKSNGQWYAGDYSNGLMYRLQWGYVYEGENIFPRSLVTGVLHNAENRVFINAFKLVVGSGQPDQLPVPVMGLPSTISIAGNVPDGYVGESIDGRYVVSGGLPPYGNVSKASGTFPPGLTLQSTGAYSGVFTTAGSYSWDTQATDSAGQTATVADTCTVVAPLWRDADKGVAQNTYDVAINPDGDFLTAGHGGDIRFTSDKGAGFSVVTPFTVSPYICAENFDGYWFVANLHSEGDGKWHIHAATDNGSTPAFSDSFNTGSGLSLRLRARNGKLFALENSPDGSFGPSFRVRTDNATWPRTTVSGISEALGSAFVDVWYIEDRYVFLLNNGVILHSPDLVSFGYAGTFSGNPTGGNWFANGRLLVKTVAGWEYSDDKGVTTHPFASAQGTTGIVFAFNKWWSGSSLYIYSSANGNDPWTLEHSNTHAPDGVAGWIWSNGTNLIIQGGNRYLNVYYVP